MTTDLWEEHAGWWQDGFTDGADPEYDEQILPLAAEHLRRRRRGARRRLRRRPGGPPRGRPAPARGRRRPDVGAARPWPRAGRRARATRGAGAGALPFADAVFDAVVACLVFEHIDDVDARHRRGRPGAASPAAASCSSSTTRCCRRRAAAGSTTRSSTRPSSTGASAPTSSRTRRSRRSRRACSSRSSTGRSSRYVNAMAAAGLFIARMEEPAPPPGFLARAAEYQTRPPSPACSSCVRKAAPDCSRRDA